MKLANYIKGVWVEGDGEGQTLYNAVNADVIANATTQGLDFAGMLKWRSDLGIKSY